MANILSTFWGIVTGFTGTKEWTQAEIEHQNKVLESQTQGALLLAGTGIGSGGAVTAGTGLSVNIAALLCLAQSTTYGPVALQTFATIARSIPASSTTYLFAAINVGNGLPDSRETRAPVFPLGMSEQMDGGVWLATVTTSATAVTGIVLAPRALSTIGTQATLTAAYTATGLEQRLDLDLAAGATVTLPLAALALYQKPRLTIANLGNAGTWTVALTSPDTFAGGATSVSLPAGQTLEVYVGKMASGSYRWAKI